MKFKRKEIEFRDDLKTGIHKGYKLSKFTLGDGSILKGQIAEESLDSITVQTIKKTKFLKRNILFLTVKKVFLFTI